MGTLGLVIAAAVVLASGEAVADPGACAPLQSEYVALLRQASPGNPAAIARQLAAAEADAESGNCHRFLFFGPPESPACPAIQATIDRLKDQLGGGRGSGWGLPQDDQATLKAELEENGCVVPSLSASGPGRTLCVRTCDGYYFPIEPRAASSRIKADAAVCQAMYGKAGLATLFVQRGDDVAEARSLDGKRYGDQPYAFQYRDTFDPACHAELKTGMASLEARMQAAGRPVAKAETLAPAAEQASAAAPAPDTAAATMPPATVTDAHDGQAALQAISAVQSPDNKRPVRFVGSAYYARMFSYSGE